MPTLDERTPMIERLARRVKIDPATGCWEWTGNVNKQGYGRLLVTGPGRSTRRFVFTHRASYEAHVGPLLPDLVIDHLCRNIICCNPDHLEQVTPEENVARGIASPTKTHCVNGHEFTPENTYRHGNRRHCRACNRANVAAYAARRAAKSVAS